jgi:competence protein ComEA
MEYLRRFRWGITVAVVVLAAAGVYLLRRPATSTPARAAPIEVYTPTPLPTESLPPTAPPAPIVVYVSGAVAEPGVYSLPADARVADALEAAGGATSETDLVQINLARRIRDEEQVHFPRYGEPTPDLPPSVHSGSAAENSEGTGALLNINTASAQELDTLPGIGPGYAQRIVDYRQSQGPFKTIEEIQNVPGIGASTFARIRTLITVE